MLLSLQPAVGAALAWVAAVSKLSLGTAYPFMRLAFVTTELLRALLVGEPVALMWWAGMGVVVAGLVLVAGGSHLRSVDEFPGVTGHLQKPGMGGTTPPVVLGILVVALAPLIFWRLTFGVGGDIEMHNVLLMRFADGGMLPTAYPMYHAMVWTISGFSHSLESLGVAAVVVLTVSVLARTLASWVYLMPLRADTAYASWKAAVVAGGLVVAMPLPNWWKFPDVYLGQITPSVWHNPTLIMAMPFTVVLFASAMWSLHRESPKVYALTSAMLVFVALAKPSYLLAFIPVYAALLVWSLRVRFASRSGKLAVLAGVLGPVLLVILAQYFGTFGEATGGGIAIRPFAVWRLFSPHIAVSLGLSVAFPLVALAVSWRRALRDSALMVAWAVFVLALLELIILAEKGKAFPYGNFFWGSYAALFVLFLTSARTLLVTQAHGWRSLVAWGAFWAHGASGVLYLVYLLVSGSRY